MTIAKLPISGISPVLKVKIADEADAGGISMNDVMVGALAARFGIAYEAVGGPPRARKKDARTTLLRMPKKVYEAVDHAAGRNPVGQRSMNAVVLRILCEHYGLPWAPPQTRRRAVTASS